MDNFEIDLMVLVNEGFRFKTGKAIQFKLFNVDDVPIDEIPLNNRAFNALKRNKYETVGQVVDNMWKLPKANSVGTKTLKEIKNSILRFAYNRMDDNQKRQFWMEVME